MEQVASKPFPWLSLLTIVGPIVLCAVGAYGATMLAQGETRKSIVVLEEQQKQMVTREELRIYMDAQRERLEDIKNTLQEIRKDVRELR